ncbi:hypothetical protein Acr_00g0053900 [Actinidia rufa]|uniref:Fasciclin-like arabinogalactan family protein n=1 Tax=Actinidia rufa TaxID=165716 RepID=A0A7J0DLM0_9ERIC|nr:hypothetical protein Acr_00g0053900 [Actinidia rufa]
MLPSMKAITVSLTIAFLGSGSTQCHIGRQTNSNQLQLGPGRSPRLALHRTRRTRRKGPSLADIRRSFVSGRRTTSSVEIGSFNGIASNSPTESTHPASVRVLRPNDVVRPDGIIHGIERLIVPRSVQLDFNRRRSLRSISAVKPEGAPEVDPRTHRLKTPSQPVAAGAPPALPICDAMAPGPSLGAGTWHRVPAGPAATSTARPRSRTSSTHSSTTAATAKWPTFSPKRACTMRFGGSGLVNYEHAPVAAQGGSAGGGWGIDGVLFPAAEEKTVAARIVKWWPEMGGYCGGWLPVAGLIGNNRQY